RDHIRVRAAKAQQAREDLYDAYQKYGPIPQYQTQRAGMNSAVPKCDRDPRSERGAGIAAKPLEAYRVLNTEEDLAITAIGVIEKSQAFPDEELARLYLADGYLPLSTKLGSDQFARKDAFAKVAAEARAKAKALGDLTFVAMDTMSATGRDQ